MKKILLFLLLAILLPIVAFSSSMYPAKISSIFLVISIISLNSAFTIITLKLLNWATDESSDAPGILGEIIVFPINVLFALSVPVFFAVLYFNIYKHCPHFFTTTIPGKLDFVDFLYFSFTTFATVGYGDIVPSVTSSKAIVIIEIINSIYILIFVVSNISAFKELLSALNFGKNFVNPKNYK